MESNAWCLCASCCSPSLPSQCRKLVRSILILGSEVIVNVYGHRVKAFFRTRSSGQGSFLDLDPGRGRINRVYGSDPPLFSKRYRQDTYVHQGRIEPPQCVVYSPHALALGNYFACTSSDLEKNCHLIIHPINL